MDKVKNVLITIRDMFSFAFTWLVICMLVISLFTGADAVKISTLWKLMGLCAWGALCFGISFKIPFFVRKGFIFSLSVFYALFVPIEIAMFYFMGIFTLEGGNIFVWIIFFAIISTLYVLALAIDALYLKKKGVEYTEKLKEYNRVSTAER
ncbi:MAG: hypothetical protein J5840_07350 [Lachnospiraceae bacterium]|nr:hypothetical protein [Lachnospiraceae bacterium]